MVLERKLLTNTFAILGGLLGTYVGLEYTISHGLIQEGVVPRSEDLKIAGLLMTVSAGLGAGASGRLGEGLADLLGYARKK
ncbi:hypothetical protein HYT55_02785 [Candidatus Woesearchaeota archaeon]|nr:hypothetical protein [Candidatus Woesearchaeota archaeon]